MRKVVVADIHNRRHSCIKLLQEVGALDEDKKRLPDVHVIQLGDRFSLGYGELEQNFALDICRAHHIRVRTDHPVE